MYYVIKLKSFLGCVFCNVPQYHSPTCMLITCKLKWDCGIPVYCGTLVLWYVTKNTKYTNVPQYHSTTVPHYHLS